MEGIRIDSKSFALSRIASVDCGATLCRVDVAHESDKHARKFLMLFIHRLSPVISGGATAYWVPAEQKSRFYIARSGSELPSRHDRSW